MIKKLFGFACVVAAVGLMMTDGQAASTPSARELYSISFGPSAVSCSDNDAGTASPCTLPVSSGTVLYTCSDPNGCTVTLAENAQEVGRNMRIVNISANTANFADTAGVTELAGALAAGQWDVLEVVYSQDRWVEVSRSNN